MRSVEFRTHTHPNGTFTALTTHVPGVGFSGQLLTHDYSELQAYAHAQPAPKGRRLTAFVSALVELRNSHPRGTMNKQVSSYGLKHDVEKLFRECAGPEFGPHEYVSNEDIIIALVQAGFVAENVAQQGCFPGPNYYFNLSPKALRLVEKTIIDLGLVTA